MDPRRDPFILWAMQGDSSGAEVYEAGDALAVVATGLFNRNRIVVSGPLEDAQRVVDQAFTDYPDHIAIGSQPLVESLAGVDVVAHPVWMDMHREDPTPPVDTSDVRWVSDVEVAPAISLANPTSWVVPGDLSVSKWAGLREGTSALASVGALAFCTPEATFLAGVATLEEYRGRGLSTKVCGFLRDHGLATTGIAALMAHGGNTSAISMYTKLGFTYRPLAAARKAPTQ